MIMTGKHRPTENPADEPASELLKQIEREKARLVKEGKITNANGASKIFRRDGHFVERKGKNEQIIDSELPFDIPDTWEWVRLWAVTTWSKKFKGVNRDWQPFVKEYPNMLARDLVAVDGGNVFIMSAGKKECWTTEELVGENLCKGEVVSIPDGGDFNVKYHKGKFVTSNSLVISSTYDDIMLNKYLYYWMLSQTKMFKVYYTGTTIDHPSKVDILNFPIPLPPLAEQERIVAKLDEVLPLVSEFGKIERELTDLEAGFPKKLKNSVLQQAVEGKLVPQDPKDAPASELLKQIEREKARLVKEGKIKKPKDASTIFRRDGHFVERKGKTEQIIDDELPFDIPDTWEWVRLETVAFLQTGTTPSTSKKEYFNGPVPFIKPADISSNGIDYDNESLSVEGAEYSRKIKANSVMMVCIGGSIGKCYYTNKGVCCNQQINTATPYLVSYKYLFYAMVSDFFQKDVIFQAGGTATPIINKSIWGSLLLPLPPLAEQERIVEKLDVFMSLEKELRAEADLRHKQLEHYRDRLITGGE